MTTTFTGASPARGGQRNARTRGRRHPATGAARSSTGGSPRRRGTRSRDRRTRRCWYRSCRRNARRSRSLEPARRLRQHIGRTPREAAMDVGIQMVFASYGWTGLSDQQVWDEEIRLARLADELGFDVLWAVEHHFYDYSFCPDNLQVMAYLAALCPNIDLGTAAVILPWNDPLRVAEKAIVLDLLSKGRLRFGIGRGLARREFAAFNQTMEQSRERFDESAAMILEALRTGVIEGNGKYYKQPRIEL